MTHAHIHDTYVGI